MWEIGEFKPVGAANVFPASNTAGFTLLELIIAIAVVAVVLGVSAPAMQRLYQSSQYHGAVNDVVDLLSSARYAAVRNGASVDVLIYPETLMIAAGRKEQQLPDNLQVEVVGARELNRDGAGVIRFYADGSSSGGNVRLQSDSGVWVQVNVDWLMGRVTLCKADCGDVIAAAQF